MSNSAVATSSSGCSLGGLVFFCFLIAKLCCNVVKAKMERGEEISQFLQTIYDIFGSWLTWFWVFFPLWAPAALVLGIILIGMMIAWILDF